MNVRLDAIVAEIIRIIDLDLLTLEPDFEELWRANRTHLIIAALVRGGIARPDEARGGNARRWRAARRLENHVGVTIHGIPDQVERHEALLGMNTYADKFSEVLDANGTAIKEVASYVLRCFTRYEKGVIEYRGKIDGLCNFYHPTKCRQVSRRSQKRRWAIKREYF
jgi:hypothetical protein